MAFLKILILGIAALAFITIGLMFSTNLMQGFGIFENVSSKLNLTEGPAEVTEATKLRLEKYGFDRKYIITEDANFYNCISLLEQNNDNVLYLVYADKEDFGGWGRITMDGFGTVYLIHTGGEGQLEVYRENLNEEEFTQLNCESGWSQDWYYTRDSILKNILSSCTGWKSVEYDISFEDVREDYEPVNRECMEEMKKAIQKEEAIRSGMGEKQLIGVLLQEHKIEASQTGTSPEWSDEDIEELGNSLKEYLQSGAYEPGEDLEADNFLLDSAEIYIHEGGDDTETHRLIRFNLNNYHLKRKPSDLQKARALYVVIMSYLKHTGASGLTPILEERAAIRSGAHLLSTYKFDKRGIETDPSLEFDPYAEKTLDYILARAASDILYKASFVNVMIHFGKDKEYTIYDQGAVYDIKVMVSSETLIQKPDQDYASLQVKKNGILQECEGEDYFIVRMNEGDSPEQDFSSSYSFSETVLECLE